MVGVPRSTGCQTCIRRRVKCDETHPECLRCQRRGLSCPGYVKARKFYVYSKNVAIDPGEAASKSTTIQPSQSSPSSPTDLIFISSSMDQVVAPSLTAKNIDLQCREGFCTFLDTKYRYQYYGHSCRLGVTWFDMVRSNQYSTAEAFNWGLRSVGALQMGRALQDDRLVHASREMYGRGLYHMARTLNNPAQVTADSTLAAAILLGGYEMANVTGAKAWMLHSRGISHLYQLRGAQAHADGMGRTLLLSFKGFLVYEALLNGESCFLEDEEWKQIIPQMIEDEKQRGKGSRLGALIDYAGYEIARCPGFVQRTKSLVAKVGPIRDERESLVKSITECQNTLHEYQTEMMAGITASRKSQETDFAGVIAADLVGPLWDYTMQGMSAAIEISNQLLTVLRADPSRRAVPQGTPGQQGFQPGKNAWEVLDYSSISRAIARGRRARQVPGPQQQVDDFESWFDRVSMTMGMLDETAPFINYTL
ncbi:Uncharacterized protein F1880_004248 [Penicillium rolfsii]|nr:Uncharacterized protein F1880_004248 [Penicillium rolfsii]